MKFIKKLIATLVAASFIATPVFASDYEGDTDGRVKLATEYYSGDIFDDLDDQYGAVPTAGSALTVKAKSSILMDVNSGKIMYENNSHEKMPPASITKIMTLILVMEAIEDGKIAINDNVTTSDHAASMGGSQIWLEPNEKMSVDDLLKATCVASANDAATALAEYVAGSEEAFVQMMNDKAAELGMKDTVFKNCTGLDADGHVSTAADIATMSRVLIKHDIIRKYSTIWMDSLRNGETQLVNTNRLVRFYDGATGLKTGTTDKAGCCLSATAERNGLELVAVVMGSDSSNDRFNAARTLLDFGFANWEMYKVKFDFSEVKPVKVKNGVKDEVKLSLPKEKPVLISKGKGSALKQKLILEESVEAKVGKGQELGKVQILLDDKVIGEYPLCADSNVEKMTFGNAFGMLIKCIVGI